MVRLSSRIALALVISITLSPRLVAAGEPPRPDCASGDAVPLGESDLREITLRVLETHPLLSSSPGVKFAEAHRACRSIDHVVWSTVHHAFVVFHPHVESAGIKQAYQAHCQRLIPTESWECGLVQIRRYLQLETQDFEVRVKGDIGHEAALALIQATRGTAQANATGGSEIPDTAIIIFPSGESYLVNWGSREGMGELTVEARLRKGGDPSRPEDWQTNIIQPEEQ